MRLLYVLRLALFVVFLLPCLFPLSLCLLMLGDFNVFIAIEGANRYVLDYFFLLSGVVIFRGPFDFVGFHCCTFFW